MSETTIDLKPFCAEFDTKYTFSAPFVLNGWRYACDGRILIRVPATGETNSDGIYPDVESKAIVPDTHLDWQPWPDTVPIKNYETCDRCRGTGREKIVTCSTCHGEREVECSECGHVHKCEECRGRGFTVEGGSCPECDNGVAYVDCYKPVGNTHIDVKYSRLIDPLPGVEVRCGQDPKDPVYFRFDGGEGVVMPVVDVAVERAKKEQKR